MGYLIPKPALSKYPIKRGEYAMFPDFFRMGTFIDNTRMKL